MKELSIEEKTKAYNKASYNNYKSFNELIEMLESVKNAIKEHNYGIAMNILCKPYPEFQITTSTELKESEDEKIRKELIFYLRHQHSISENFEDIGKWIAWLEKQGKERTVNYPIEGMFPYTEPADTLDGEIENIWNKLRNCDNTFTAAKSGFYEVIHHFANWLEKQSYTKKDVDDAYLKGICDAKHELEKQGEQESADKHEPKFKNGQWIVWQNKCYKVNNNGCGYELIDQSGLSTSLEYGTVDKSAHLWTIQDVRKGDVLVYKGALKYSNGIKYERICLFNNIDNAFFTLTKTSNYVEEYDINVNIDYPDNTVPATKKQKELLFMAMKEAGYKWDVDKKELKNIVVPKFKIGDTMRTLQEASNGITSGLPVIVSIDNEYYHCNNELIAIKDQDDYEFPPMNKKPTTWSEEDNVMIRCITLDLELLKNRDDGKAGKAAYQSEIEWLKSIKDRVGCEVNCTTTKKWKPSDAQMSALSDINCTGCISYAGQGQELINLYNDLKKLKS